MVLRLRTTAKLQNIDEIQQFIDARYIAQEECVWRTLKFEMKDHFPAVETLSLHLENQQTILYKSNDDVNEIIKGANDTHLTLLV